MSMFMPCLVFGAEVPRLGDPLLDEYLRFVAARARPNTVIAQAFDLKVFFAVVGKPPAEVSAADVLAFITEQRAPRRGQNVRRLADGEAGLSARTVKRRVSSVSGLFTFLVIRGVVAVNPVPRGLATRRPGHVAVPLIRTPRTLPRILQPAEATALLAALRTDRDRAMIALMLLGGLRRCEVLGMRLADVDPGARRVFIVEGKGGRQRQVPVASGFFTALAGYLDGERPPGCVTDRVFVVLKGPHRGQGLTAAGLDEVLAGARRRAGLKHATCHELRHTCLTRLRESGMALEAVQAQAGHASIETTRIYLHLTGDWLAGEYRRAMDVLDGITDSARP